MIVTVDMTVDQWSDTMPLTMALFIAVFQQIRERMEAMVIKGHNVRPLVLTLYRDK